MKPITHEWVEKAEGDFHTAQREFRARKYPNYDAACFHVQQCIEKYLKARLVEAEIDFPKIHDLTQLLSLVEPVEPFWIAYQEELRTITDYAIEYRYPGITADKDTAQKALKICKNIRIAIRQSLGLEP
ncbi:MAG: HEPN domain-containing protein [Chloroflexi bacterium]|nr:HEPN domain-containing protein [Chloroflexota bacterium]